MDFSWLWDWIELVANWHKLVLKSIFSAIWKIATDVLCWALDKALGLAVDIIKSFDISGLGSVSAGFASLGADILNMAGLVGIKEALGIIVAALVIRMLLQLIPFTRLGS
ncbi:DUF2523 family protein [Uliginosibacterium sp. TH139]|uniref:DUF2523 family protein n=1 Tax=Uliginosibacterium sp. TH139 TaxID=2067453 RepID=UPI000C7AE83F|nr:DUF2523 family protein [Uliginosibacterium sp. TH139]PLK46940.1 hypothetical protein C0V76_19310 [Uliginosibacterium sp. TH139]